MPGYQQKRARSIYLQISQRQTMRKKHEINEQGYALQMHFWKSGSLDDAKAMKEITYGTPGTETRY